METWRLLIQEEPQSGAWNMAVDEAIARQIAAGQSLPTLRLYAWQPACVSLGRHQPLAEIDVAACRRDGIDIVRRPTGGRAILHVDELTYSVSSRPDQPVMRGNVLDAYLRLSTGLMRGLELLGATVTKAPGDTGTPADVSAICFEVPSAYEIMDGRGRKLVGSAQTRHHDWVLQHGSLPLYGDVTRLATYLALPAPERQALAHRLAQRATTLSETVGRSVTWAEAADALRRGFQEAIDIHFVTMNLSPKEIDLAREIETGTYGNEIWTKRK